jgi:hypothetical protein
VRLVLDCRLKIPLPIDLKPHAKHVLTSSPSGNIIQLLPFIGGKHGQPKACLLRPLSASLEHQGCRRFADIGAFSDRPFCLWAYSGNFELPAVRIAVIGLLWL